MYAPPIKPAAGRPVERALTIVSEGAYGRHQRIDLLVTPGTTWAALQIDADHDVLLAPGGVQIGAEEDLFETAADMPRLFALRSTPRPVSNPWPRASFVAGFARAVGHLIAHPKRAVPVR
jgi:hypothetical protein